jgi:hypothetical protein
MVWHPARVDLKDWVTALDFYRHLTDRNQDFRPLCDLVAHGGSQSYATSLSLATSGTALLVARERHPEWPRDALRIDVTLSGAVRFAFPRGRLAKPKLVDCQGPDVLRVFERFAHDADPAKPSRGRATP